MIRITQIFPSRRRSRAQGLVEFALILPILMLLIFVIIEAARLLHAWLAIENGARFGVRYAVTGEWNPDQCTTLFGADCADEAEEDAARIPSIKDAAEAGAVAILADYDNLTDTVGDPRFFKVTVCSDNVGITYTPGNPNIPTAADCHAYSH